MPSPADENGDRREPTVAELKDRIAQLEGLLGMPKLKPPPFHFTPTERRIIGMLLQHELMSREMAFAALWGARPDCDQPAADNVDHHIHNLRQALKRHGIAIATEWGVGWYLTSSNRARLKALLEQQ